MHSSRMCTGRSLTVCYSLLPGEVCSRGVSALGEGVSAPGVSALGGVCSWGVPCGGCLLLGGGLLQGGCTPACTEADTLPPCGQNS